MKNPESEVTSSDFSEVETKNELRKRVFLVHFLYL